MDLMKEDEYFRTALLGILAEKGRGAQNTLSIDAGLSDAYVSQIINGKRHATQKTQVRIAEALGMDYVDFLALGKKLTTGDAGMKNDDEDYIKQTVLKHLDAIIELQRALNKMAVAREGGNIADHPGAAWRGRRLIGPGSTVRS
jgi:transcriptional regulator with XRE-family HTH domain